MGHELCVLPEGISMTSGVAALTPQTDMVNMALFSSASNYPKFVCQMEINDI
jgi:hypothetical protein